MSDVGGLGRVPSGIERVNRSHASRDEPRRPKKDKHKQKKDPKSEAVPSSEHRSDDESIEKETGAVIDVLDDGAEDHEESAPNEDSDDLDSEERGRHLDTRA